MPEKLRIAFVDDELHVLNALRRSLSELENEWDMTFCTSGKEVLGLMARQPFDVLVADMRMPQMDGGQLLQAVKAEYPGTVRVILSGYADTEAILRTVGVSHCYLAKPCDASELRQTISRQVALNRKLNNPKLRATLAALANLPTPSSVFLKLENEVKSPNSSFKSVADIVSEDMAMVAEILRVTNSAYFSVNGRVTTPMQAVRILGLEIVRALVLRIGLFRQFQGSKAVAPIIGALSDYGLVVGRIAEAIALRETGDAEHGKAAYCAALLSSIGCLILLDGFGDGYAEMLAGIDARIPLYHAEEARFGASHTVVGAYLLGLWGFSNATVEAVAYSNFPSGCSSHDNILLTAVHAALALGPQLPLSPLTKSNVLPLDTDYLTAAGLTGSIDGWCELAAQISLKR